MKNIVIFKGAIKKLSVHNFHIDSNNNSLKYKTNSKIHNSDGLFIPISLNRFLCINNNIVLLDYDEACYVIDSDILKVKEFVNYQLDKPKSIDYTSKENRINNINNIIKEYTSSCIYYNPYELTPYKNVTKSELKNIKEEYKKTLKFKS